MSLNAILMNELPTSRLIYILRDRDPEARVDALRQLADRATEREAHDALYEASFSTDPRLRIVAARVLSAYEDERNLVRLTDLLVDRRAEIRQVAAETLGQLADPGATLPLIEALSDSNRWVVIAAAEGLGRFGTPAARVPLRKLQGSKDWGISQTARKALADLEERLP